MGADPLRRLAKQPFDAKAQTYKYGKEQQALGPPVSSKVCGDEAGRLAESGWADRGARRRARRCARGSRRHGSRNRARSNSLRASAADACGGFGLALLLQPIAHLRIGEQRHQLLDLLWRRLVADGWRPVRRPGGRCSGGPRQHGRGREQDDRCEAAPHGPQDAHSHSRADHLTVFESRSFGHCGRAPIDRLATTRLITPALGSRLAGGVELYTNQNLFNTKGERIQVARPPSS